MSLRRGFLLFFLASILQIYAGPQNSPPSTGVSATAEPQQIVGVSGIHMTLNDRLWLSRGVVLQGFVRPLAALQADPSEAAVLNARLNYGPAELQAIRAFHADTIRFQISQPALDPNSPLYDASYLPDVVNAIKTARQAGFVVMIMMQDETITGDAEQSPLPTAETQSDWDLFTPVFGADRGVVFELYNEPVPAATPGNWQLWLGGGVVPGETVPSIGMQTLVSHIRGGGAQNVFALDGLGRASTLDGVPAVNDPLGRLVYAVHPYQHGSSDESQWDAEFGIPSMTIPVWTDEWSAPTELALGLGVLPNFQVAVDLLNYLRSHLIPLCTGAFDVPHFVVQVIPGWTLTNYQNYSPSSTTEGSGTLVYNDFADDYRRVLTDQDGLRVQTHGR